MELGEPDESGRRKPVAVKGSEFIIPVQTVIEAIGQRPNPIIQSTTKGLETGKHGVVVTNDVQKTSREGVFAGGDLSRGGATVILAMRDGKTAASAIHNYLISRKNGKGGAHST
jgi:glutamate synthase (NADPH/NADH) small chain